VRVKSSPNLRKTPTSRGLTTESLKYLPPELVTTRTTKPLVAVQRMADATVPEGNCHKIPTAPRHQLEDLLRAAIVPVVLVGATTPQVTATLVVEAAAVGAPHMGLAGEPAMEVIAEAEDTQTVTSSLSHAAAMMPTAELKKYGAKCPQRQATTTASPPSPLDFAISFSQRNSNLWGSPSTMRSKTQFDGSDAMPYPSKSAFSFPSAWTKRHSPSPSRSKITRLTSGTNSRLSSPATSRAPWDAQVLAWTWQW
jgi:hypothetical protein